LEPEEALQLLDSPYNREIIFPYLIGKDFTTHPEQAPSRYVINFGERALEEAMSFPECMSIVRSRVYEYRQTVKTKKVRENWWLFEHRAPALFSAIEGLDRVLIRSRVSNKHAVAFVSKEMIYSDATVVFAYDDDTSFAVIQSSLHEQWAVQYSSTMKRDLRYAPTDVFETFPFPYDLAPLEEIGERYHEHRRAIMLARQEGLTATYNRFHDPDETAEDIAHLRDLHVEMDQAVAAAYGWDDLDLGHGFHETAQGVRFTISESARREVLTRLLRLNHERYAEEVRQGLHEKGSKRGKGKRSRGAADDADPLEQGELFDDGRPKQRRLF